MKCSQTSRVCRLDGVSTNVLLKHESTLVVGLRRQLGCL